MVTTRLASYPSVTLSANASANGMPRLVLPFKVARMGDYAKRPEGRERRALRLARIADKRLSLES